MRTVTTTTSSKRPIPVEKPLARTLGTSGSTRRFSNDTLRPLLPPLHLLVEPLPNQLRRDPLRRNLVLPLPRKRPFQRGNPTSNHQEETLLTKQTTSSQCRRNRHSEGEYRARARQRQAGEYREEEEGFRKLLRGVQLLPVPVLLVHVSIFLNVI
jgi:hypothetical protein